MNTGIRTVPTEGDKIKFVQKTVDPTTSDFSYPIPTIWLNTTTGKAWMHFGAGVWTQFAGSGSGGEWGAAVPVTISGGVITVEAGKWYKVESEVVGFPDDLDTINGLSEGEEVMLSQYEATHIITLRSGVGNLSFSGGVNIIMDALIERVRLVHDGINLVEASSRP